MPWDSKIPKLVATVPARAAIAIHAVGLDMQDIAQAHARVRTGYMREHIIWDRARSELVGEAGYTIFNELGTRYMSAQPMFAPALLAGEALASYHFRQVFE
jgi:hypothetical protein